MKNQAKPFNAWWLAGISVLFAFATLYLAVLHSSVSVQYARSFALAQHLNELKTTLTNDWQHQENSDMSSKIDRALKSAEHMRTGNKNILKMTSIYSLTGILSLACAAGAFWGTPRKAAWLALPFGMCAVMVAFMWF